ncbi:MAG: hypothetical protein ABW250_27180 [Pyrinomonadaceae bacterium]
MSYWLYSSKVRLGLLVNGLYLLSLALPSHSQVGGRPYAYTYREWTENRTSPPPPTAYPPLPAARGESKAETNYVQSADQLDVYLKRDLMLVDVSGHTLLLSPTFSTSGRRAETPRTALLRFVSFSSTQVFDNNSPMVITADGTELWRYGTDSGADATPSGAKVLHSVTRDEEGRVVETIGHEVPYEVFYNMLVAEHVDITLGRDSVELNTAQVEALRDMHRRIDNYPPPAKSRTGYAPYYKPKRNS